MSATAFLIHYVEYLTSPQLLLTIGIVVLPLFFTTIANNALSPNVSSSTGVPQCRRLGLYTRSNLDDQFEKRPSISGPPRVKALFTYPVKSCRGVELAASEVEAKGLRYDRLFTFCQWVPKKDPDLSDHDSDSTHEWRFMTQREIPRLALLQTQLWLPDPRRARKSTRDVWQQKSSLGTDESQPRARSRPRGSTLMGQLETGSKEIDSIPGGTFADNGGCLVLQFQYSPSFNPFGLRGEKITIQVPLNPTRKRAEVKHYQQEPIVIWKDLSEATNVTSEISSTSLEKLRHFLGVTGRLALFRVDENNLRPVTRSLPQERKHDDFQIGFVDAFSVNLLGLASVRAVGENIPSTSAMKNALDARRFRANIYTTGTSAFTEDTWKKIVLGRRIGRDEQGLFETEAEYHIACRTARCTLPNVDAESGERDRNEPYTTLSKTRQVDKGAYPHPCLGMQCIPLFERGFVRVGDEIEVLSTGDHVYEKMFP